jgi:hypothetical protein
MRAIMLFEKSDIHISAVDYAIDYDKEKKIATITPTVHVSCAKSQLLVASIHVDDHELRPSLKLVLDEGEHSYIIPYVKIVNPLLSTPEDNSSDKEYKMTLKLHFGDDEVYDLDENIRIIES